MAGQIIRSGAVRAGLDMTNDNRTDPASAGGGQMGGASTGAAKGQQTQGDAAAPAGKAASDAAGPAQPQMQGTQFKDWASI